MKSFSEFMGRKERDNKSHLHLLKQILEKAGFAVKAHFEEGEPYVYVLKPTELDPILESLTFGGVRIYTRGNDMICYRCQNKETTEPWGSSYLIDLKDWFKDLISEHNAKAVGNRLIFYIIQELKTFFLRSAKAEKEEEGSGEGKKMGTAQVAANTNGPNDYANTVSSPGTNYGGAV